MDISNFFDQVVIQIGSKEVTVGHYAVAFAWVAFIYFLYQIILKPFFSKYFAQHDIEDAKAKSIRRLIENIFILIASIAILIALDVDFILYSTDYENPNEKNITLRISSIIGFLIMLQIAWVFDWIISRIIEDTYQKQHADDPPENQSEQSALIDKTTAGKSVQYLLYTFFIMLFVRASSLDYKLIDYEDHSLYVSSILVAILFLLGARLAIFIISELVLFSYFNKNKVDLGARFAMNQLVKYIVYVIAFLMAINALGVNLTVLFGAGAALLVGIGFALQQTFNDFFSGIILLFERSVKVGDTIVVDEQVGIVKEIGLRTTLIESLARVAIVVPNSIIVSNKMENWSNSANKLRFDVKIGVAYGTDTDKVKALLIDIANDNPHILPYPRAKIRFTNFGDSSLDFELLFWTRNYIIIEDIKSDLRFAIDNAFKENDIEIPFPQRVIWKGGA